MDIELEAKKIRSELEKFSLPAIKLFPKAEKAEHIWSTKFGGKPYWPKGKAYPVSDDGAKLILLAQLNFDELPKLSQYPESGILQFFIEDDDVYGMDFDRPTEEVISSPSGYRVIYHPEIEKNELYLEQDLPGANDEHFLPASREYRIECILDKEIPSPTDYRYEMYASDPLEYEDDLAEYVYENFSAEGSKIGGYASFAQEDPRISEKKDNWLLLFQMDSELVGDNQIMWGDMGVGNFFIEREALKKKDFSKVWYNWDCC
ncbi:YwqG family protein [Microbulbifer sp. TRSA001]|uniref:YwqG family protein n=1 Tax=unclassified Microbulbifer TaxID=2619833 RepID=UPI0024ADF7D9|nr:YwqG family protein [Microbulbifer sp. VAAF005]WHI46923.1 YwqG family protein [Microbulbifer sp. VAAF005]